MTNTIRHIYDNKLYVGPALSSIGWKSVYDLGIKYAYDFYGSWSFESPVRDSIIYTYYHIPDGELTLEELTTMHKLAREAGHRIRRGSTVISLCQQGLNRSGLFAALILVNLGKSAEEAIRLVKASEPNALFNLNFLKYIQEFAAVVQW